MPTLEYINNSLKDLHDRDYSPKPEIYNIPLSKRLSESPYTKREEQLSGNQRIKESEGNKYELPEFLSKLKDIIPSPESMMSNLPINPKHLFDYASGEKTAAQAGLPVAGNIASFGMPFAGKAGEPLLKAVGKGVGRTMYGGATGAAMSEGEEPEDAIKKSMIVSGAAEAIPSALGGIGRLAETIIPKQFTRNMINSIKTIGDKIYANVKKYYNSSVDKYGSEKIDLTNLNASYNRLKKLLSPDTKLAYDELQKNPTVSNAHTFQRQAGEDLGTLSKDKAVNLHKIQASRNMRELALDEMRTTIRNLDPKAGDLFKKGSDAYKDYYSFFKKGKTMEKIRKGKGEDIKPEQLQKALKDLDLEKGHPLHMKLSDLTSKLNTGKTVGNILTGGVGTTLGSIAGSTFFPGAGTLLGGALGGIAGPVSKHFAGHPLLSLAQNKQIVDALKALEIPYRIGTRQLTPAIEEGIGK